MTTWTQLSPAIKLVIAVVLALLLAGASFAAIQTISGGSSSQQALEAEPEPSAPANDSEPPTPADDSETQDESAAVIEPEYNTEAEPDVEADAEAELNEETATQISNRPNGSNGSTVVPRNNQASTIRTGVTTSPTRQATSVTPSRAVNKPASAYTKKVTPALQVPGTPGSNQNGGNVGVPALNTPKPAQPDPVTPKPTPTPTPKPTPSPTPSPSPTPTPAQQDTAVLDLPRDQKDGWTTYETPVDGNVYYVSSSTGSDSNDGLSPETAYATLAKAFEKYQRNGAYNDFILFKRGDVFESDFSVNWGRYSGVSASQPMLVGSYGTAAERPRLELIGQKTVLGEVNNWAFIGLDFYFPAADPKSSKYDPNRKGQGLSFVGNMNGLLFEDVRFQYGQFNIQGVINEGVGYGQNVEIRRSQIAYSWSENGCSNGKAQGLYLFNIRNMTIDQTYFLHNGWSPTEAQGCANMFNHNLYATAMQDFTVKDSIFLHSSSISFKVSAFGPNEDVPGKTYENLLVENSFFSDSEIGISMGGNGNDADRINNSVIRGNVFSELGSDNATNRNFHWGIEVMGNRGSLIEGNYLVNSNQNTNSVGIRVGYKDFAGNTDVTIRNNTFYDYAPSAIAIAPFKTSSNVQFVANRVVVNSAPRDEACMIRAADGMDPGVSFSQNQYRSPLGSWACIQRDRLTFAQWKAAHEPTASEFTGTFVDPGRTLTSYATYLGYPSEAALEQAMLNNHKHNWDDRLTGDALTQYVKDGYKLK